MGKYYDTENEETPLERQVKDCNGILLKEGDNASLIKSLKLKGSATTLKQGAVAKRIRFTDDDTEVDCKVENMAVVLKTEFLRKL